VAVENQTAAIPLNISAGLCSMEHERCVHGGTVCAYPASGNGRAQEGARSRPAIRAGAQDGSQDAAVFRTARLSAAAAHAAAELEAWTGIIDQILDEDKERSKKQRHTAKRIFERLRDEHGFMGGYTIEGVRAAAPAEPA
jgi:hypothetical protein